MYVTFCGHSRINHPEVLSNWLDLILPSLIEGGADTFYLGGYGDFDAIAATAVHRQKETYPHVDMILVLAYLNRDIDTSYYDGTTYPPLEKVPPRYAIVKRNEWMVSASDIVISGVKHGWGGAAKTLVYAQKKHKVIFQFPYQKSDGAETEENSSGVYPKSYKG